MVFGGMWMLVFWGGVVWLIAWSLSRLGRGQPPAHETPMDIARRRLASGEITPDQFEQLKRELS